MPEKMAQERQEATRILATWNTRAHARLGEEIPAQVYTHLLRVRVTFPPYSEGLRELILAYLQVQLDPQPSSPLEIQLMFVDPATRSVADEKDADRSVHEPEPPRPSIIHQEQGSQGIFPIVLCPQIVGELTLTTSERDFFTAWRQQIIGRYVDLLPLARP